MFTLLLFTIGLVAFAAPPQLVAGDTFTVIGVREPGPYLVTAVVFLPDGSYPPSDGSPGCDGAVGLAVAGLAKAFRPGEPVWAVCVTPSPRPPQAYAYDVEVVRSRIFTDGFESGDTTGWSLVKQVTP